MLPAGTSLLRTTPMIRALSLASLLVLTGLAGPAVAQEPASSLRLLTITGHGEVKARPDMAVVRLGVVTQAAAARQALDDNNKAMQAILAALAEEGFAQQDLQTSNFSVTPRYDYGSGQDRPPRIDGYEVSNQLAVTVRDLGKLGAVLDRAVSLGANQIFGIAFAVSEPEGLRDQARRMAVSSALSKANLYAAAASVDLGPVHSIAESSAVRPPQPAYQMRMAAEAAAAVPIVEGEQVIEVEITMSWVLQ